MVRTSLKHSSHIQFWGVQGGEQLDDAGAAALAALLAQLRGPQAPGAAPAECRTVSAESMADIFTVRR